MKTEKILLAIIVLVVLALTVYLALTTESSDLVPREIYFICYASFFFLAGMVFSVFLFDLLKKQKNIPPAILPDHKYNIQVEYDTTKQNITLVINHLPLELHIHSKWSFQMFREAVESFRNKLYVGCVNLCHSSIEHIIIVELYGGYKEDEPFSTANLPKMYHEKVSEFIKKYPRLAEIKNDALKLWNMNRLTYVQTIPEGLTAVDPSKDSKEENNARRREYCSNEDNLIAGVESIAYESLQTAANIHKAIGTLYQPPVP